MQNNNKEQKNDILLRIQEAAKQGSTIVHNAILRAYGEIVYISETFVKKEELHDLETLLEKVKVAKTIEEEQMLLGEDSIPVELVIINQFWGEFQELIYQMQKDKMKDE